MKGLKCWGERKEEGVCVCDRGIGAEGGENMRASRCACNVAFCHNPTRGANDSSTDVPSKSEQNGSVSCHAAISFDFSFGVFDLAQQTSKTYVPTKNGDSGLRRTHTSTRSPLY